MTPGPEPDQPLPDYYPVPLTVPDKLKEEMIARGYLPPGPLQENARWRAWEDGFRAGLCSARGDTVKNPYTYREVPK